MAVPTRTCLACRQRSAKPSLIRLAVVDGTVQVDPLATIQARGAYLCAGRRCAEQALQRDGAAIARALRTGPAAVGSTTLDVRIAEEITRRKMSNGSSETVDKVAAKPSRGVCT